MLFPLLLIVPLLELYVMIVLGKSIGLINTLLIIGSTSFFGILLVKREGWQVISKIKSNLNQGQVPGNEVLEGFLVVVGALLFLTPGLITDLLGVFFLFPGSRVVIRNWIKIRLWKWIAQGKIKIY
ncbi:FxsA family protein [Candidatus Formimonas warabiya]|uniref:FxsA family protein n=1 Tax=Formimonas warabiya TaxID=1761012 RepID=A0A3G1L130_FORW1|nr:FxsA family protein [Candidatus Formimonas warabiya]ATW28368.1 hypothetical protein DCMF_05060 [Candidatus Formimonas warabiya]